jgi:hypothetical protein
VANLDDLVVPLRVHAPGASLSLLKQAYREAARKFFQETRAWRETVSVTSGANPATYTLGPDPANAEAFDAMLVKRNNDTLRKATRSQFKARYATGSTPVAFRVGAADTLFLAPEPASSIASELAVIAALRPTRAAAELDDEVVDHFEEALLDGARWKLLMMPESWGNSSKGEYYRKNFQDAIDRYRGTAADDHQVGVIRKTRYGGY